MLDGVGLIVGIDRFMSEARAVTNFAGNAIACMLVATWTKEIDREQLDRALSGESPFDEATMLDDDGPGGGSSDDTLVALDSNTGPAQSDLAKAERR